MQLIVITSEQLPRTAGNSHDTNCVSILYILSLLIHIKFIIRPKKEMRERKLERKGKITKKSFHREHDICNRGATTRFY